jgi:DNA-binding CsgD family transcriptional regulator
MRISLKEKLAFTRGMAALLLHKYVGNPKASHRNGAEQLTDRELHVLHLLGAGLSTREIAGELKLSFKTIETHRENIKRKLGLQSATALIHYATQWSRQEVSVPAPTLADNSLSHFFRLDSSRTKADVLDSQTVPKDGEDKSFQSHSARPRA